MRQGFVTVLTTDPVDKINRVNPGQCKSHLRKGCSATMVTQTWIDWDNIRRGKRPSQLRRVAPLQGYWQVLYGSGLERCSNPSEDFCVERRGGARRSRPAI